MKFAAAALAVLAALVVGAWAVVSAGSSTPKGAGQVVGYSAPRSAAPPRATRTVGDVVSAMRSGRPVTVQVLGDSTGNDPGEWVDLWARAMGARYDRTVTLSTVNPTTLTYPTPVTVHEGSGAPVTVRNGSVGGYSAASELAKLGRLTAGRPADLLFVNLGHNGVEGAALNDEAALVDEMLRRWPHVAPVIIVQNPEIPPSQGVARQAFVTGQLRDFARLRGFAFVDVFAAFSRASDEGALFVPGGVHTSRAGSRLWARQVETLFPR